MKNCSFAAVSKFLGRDYGKRGPIAANFWGEITVKEVNCCKFLGEITVIEAQLKNCSFAAANFWGEIRVREA